MSLLSILFGHLLAIETQLFMHKTLKVGLLSYLVTSQLHTFCWLVPNLWDAAKSFQQFRWSMPQEKFSSHHKLIPQEVYPLVHYHAPKMSPVHTPGKFSTSSYPKKYVHWFLPLERLLGLLAAYEMRSNLFNSFTGPCSRIRKSFQV